jgi:hypothetical protein
MMKNPRFVQSVTQTASTNDIRMPWTRGKHRAAFIQKRTAKVKLAKTG